MSTVIEIENAVSQLKPEDLAAFRVWFAKYDAGNWDQQFEADVRKGSLAWLRAEALDDLREGRCSER
jgi:hypothetical protein